MSRFFFIDPKTGELMLNVSKNTYQEACWNFELKYRLSVKVLIESGKIVVESLSVNGGVYA